MRVSATPVELIDQLRSWFHPKDRVLSLSDDQYIYSKRVAWETAVSKLQNLPGLVGCWPMSSVQRSTGNVYDLSGQGRTLTYNGNPVFSIYQDFVSYIECDGVGDYLSRADETDLDVLGTEAIYATATRGLTMGGWFWFNAVTASNAMMSKWLTTGVSGGHLLYFGLAGIPNFLIEDAAGAVSTVTSSVTVTTGAWYFIVARFRPAVELALWVNRTKDTVAGPVANIRNNAQAFVIGGWGTLVAPRLLTGRASLCFLCANALSDAQIEALFQQTRKLFGV